MKRMLIVTFALAATCFGCNPSAEVSAKYDAMTGERLPEKPKPRKIHRITRGDGYEVAQTEIEGHLYFIANSSRSYAGVSIIHAASCPCKTNHLNDVER